MPSKLLSRRSLFCCMVLLCTHLVWAQATTSLGGLVTDNTNAIIPGASVKLVLTATGGIRVGTTNSRGEYQFSQLAPGRYSLTVTATGFGTVEKTGMNLLVSQPATLNVVLSIADVQQQVTVTSNVQPVLNTSDATLGNSFDQKQVEDLPIFGRSVPDLLSLQPGVTYLGRTSTQTASSNGNTSTDSRSGTVNGGRSDQSNITLDGIDVNDINNGYAFDSVLRVTQDSLAEFRVTTSNPNANVGHGSGAQVTLITKSGSNTLHGAVYAYNKNNLLQANDFFTKQTEASNGQPNVPGKLILNVFGADVGGPIKKDRAFFFLNYEGTRQTQGVDVNAGVVPFNSFRQGNLIYNTANAPPVPATEQTLTPAILTSMDPLGIGPSQAMEAVLNSYPQGNDPTQGDAMNTEGYRFLDTQKLSLNTYIARFDWNITRNGNHTVFWRGNLQNDNEPGTPAFPGQPPSTLSLNNSKGFAVGYTAVLTSNLVNMLAFGLTRQGTDNAGISNQPQVILGGIAAPQAFTRSTSVIAPVYDLTDNLTWAKHNHDLAFGGDIRFILDRNISTADSFPDGYMNPDWLFDGGVANKKVPLDPSISDCSPGVLCTPVASQYEKGYNNLILTVMGIIPEVDATYNFTKTGASVPLGAPLTRNYRWDEFEGYAQDSWKALKNLTLTYGLRYSYLQVPAEESGAQVGTCLLVGGTCQPYSLTQYLQASAQQAATGGAANNVGHLAFDLNGRYNNRPDYWTPDKADFAPRFAFAFQPSPTSGFWKKLFGNGQSSIRGGYSLAYDHFGAALINTFDTTGSYGLSSDISNPADTSTTTNSPRFTGISSIPTGLLPPAPQGAFPAEPAPGGVAISWGLDSKIKTPYSHVVDFSIQRELSNGSSLEISYVGRFAHRLLAQEDVAMPINLQAAGSSYFAEARKMSLLARANSGTGVPVSSVQPVAYWETLFGALDGVDLGYGAGPASATQNIYQIYQANLYNETNALYLLDMPDSTTGAGINPGQTYPSYRFYHDQYSALYAWRSVGNSNYNALQAVYRQRFGHGLQADFNYTYSKSLDITSQAERVPTSGGNNSAQILNTWNPNQLYGDSDFDVRHQINSNYVWDLPFGRGKQYMSSASRLMDEFIGGWTTTGIIRWTSGLPFEMDNGSNYPTNWDIEGLATQVSKIPAGAAKRGLLQQQFANPTAVFNSFTNTLPGDSGTRNSLRGDGYFSWDTGLGKSFSLAKQMKLQLRWEMFNVTNSVRFDPHSISARLDTPTAFGVATSTLTTNRTAQFSGRFEF